MNPNDQKLKQLGGINRVTERVTDTRSNTYEQIANAALVIGRSNHRQWVFKAVYFGKKSVKTVIEIMQLTGLSQKQVLTAGAPMATHELIKKIPEAYQKDEFFKQHYRRILEIAQNPSKIKQLPIQRFASVDKQFVNIRFPKQAKRAQQITVDDIDSFALIKNNKAKPLKSIYEEEIKLGFQKIIGDGGNFKDWGGEKSDLFTTKLRLNGKRIVTAIAFKGRGTSGKLTPKKMGANGDQIGRLFNEPAQVFLVVYCGQIESSVVDQMRAFAIVQAIGRDIPIYYGIIDADDLGRVASAYSDDFKL